MTDGIDVYSGNGHIDWGQVPGLLGIAKATEGTYFRCPLYTENLLGIGASGKRPGAYHFARDNSGARQQAEWFLGYITPARSDQILALDLEPFGNQGWSLDPDDTVRFALTWLATVEQSTGIRPWWYTYPSFAAMMSRGQGFDDLGAYPLWWADPSDANPAPYPPALVQYGQEALPGTNGPVDVNRVGPAYRGTLPPVPPATREEATGMYIAIDYSTNRCWLFAGNVRIRDFTGAPGFAGVPQDALDYAGGVIPIKPLNTMEMDLLDHVSKKLLS